MMPRITCSFFIALLLSTAAHAVEEDTGPLPDDTLIVPGVRAGIVNKLSTEEKLISQVKPEEYHRSQVGVGEGQCRYGSVLYPGTGRELYIVWESNKDEFQCLGTTVSAEEAEAALAKAGELKNPEYLVIESPEWFTAEGVKIGATLAELEKINGKPFTFSGFGWDYGGRVTSWEKGVIDKLNIALNYGDLSPELEKKIPLGDRPVSSDDKNIPREAISVTSIYMTVY
jgi:hypothetical protein